MRPPATLADVVDLVRTSKLVADDRLAVFLAAAGAAGVTAAEPAALLARMTREGLLTPFQAGQLRAGRCRGFYVGNYRVLDKIGAGGMGHVYLPEHVTLGTRAAIKVLHAKLADDRTALARFVREAKAAGRLEHPNIVRVFDVCTASRPPYLVMEYIDGVTLQAAVARHGTFTPGDAAGIGRQVAMGLHQAYAAGLVHRDIKPANILIDRRGVAKLLDLGIVRIEGEQPTAQTGERMILGTIDYLAPEQAIDSSTVDTRADIYSLGATLYFLLTGRPPFPDGNVGLKLMRLQVAAPPPVRDDRPDVPPGLAAVIHTMLAKKPADRYDTPFEAADALADFAAESAGFLPLLFGAAAARPTVPDIGLTVGRTPPAGFIATPVPATPTVAITPSPFESGIALALSGIQHAPLTPAIEAARAAGKTDRTGFRLAALAAAAAVLAVGCGVAVFWPPEKPPAPAAGPPVGTTANAPGAFGTNRDTIPKPTPAVSAAAKTAPPAAGK